MDIEFILGLLWKVNLTLSVVVFSMLYFRDSIFGDDNTGGIFRFYCFVGGCILIVLPPLLFTCVILEIWL